ncbi:hypothetical protein VT84_08580 [Gemmata sp. SH-PL17]|uniref:hypothetical protein n=1 Tax=Gemmata sp. SH-PL17 TaxID=1630693 RepID=UPI0004B823B9|nr:hypothetical protein [Gemmata sp. SH-PL17]AMV24439.1 hypothetical protein VT84_08580 [Gemmata sp. SH-PL17]
MFRTRVFRSAVALLGLTALLASTRPTPGGQPDPVAPTPPEQLSPLPPTEVDFQQQNEGEKDRPFFDDFAWRDFIALNWPADANKRGEPHPCQKFGDTSGPTVWETWKSMSETFPADPVANPPSPWSDFAAVLSVRGTDKTGKGQMVPAPLPKATAGRTKLLTRLSKLEDLNQAGFPPSFVEFPLVAQNKTLVRYEVRVNRVAYEEILAKKYYRRENLPPVGTPAEFCDQSITIKAAWMEVTDESSPRWKRFYRTRAKLVDWEKDGTPDLTERPVALIGLHVVHKTPKRGNWIWATFEHVDNTELSAGGVSPPNLNSKDGGTMFGAPGTNVPQAKIEFGKPIPKDLIPVEVARRTEIHSTTNKVNGLYQGHAMVKDTVWSNYRLIATQWPTAPGNGDADARFPVGRVANATMETYHQGSNCIGCHSAAERIKFVFFPEVRAVGAGTAAAVDRINKLLKDEQNKAVPEKAK